MESDIVTNQSDFMIRILKGENGPSKKKTPRR